MKRGLILLTFLCLQIGSFGQAKFTSQNWHWKDYDQDSIHGISLLKAYQLLCSLNIKSTPIVVAVMDGGIDTNHLALKSKLWINVKEIPGNGIDDDRNGYIDDVHGWNFLGGSNGENINKAAAEKSRIYHHYKSLYESDKLDTTSFTKVQLSNYRIWKQAALEMEFSDEEAANLQYIKMASNALQKLGNFILKEMNDSNFTVVQLEPFQPIGKVTLDAKIAYLRTAQILGIDKETGFKEIMDDLKEYIEGKEKAAIAKQEAPEPIRARIIKDKYENLADKFYGNNDITGPNAKHGTHVAGLVASIPDSSWEINHLYPPIQIMGIRVVPDGDEYDKDIALGIRYAVDNGAKIINMSFGKSFSPEQIWVDSAIRYAASKDVLIVHSAGNEFYNLDIKPVYPTPYSSLLNDTAHNVLTVGASSDPYLNGTLITDFSNYGPKIVDVLSPGNKIYSTFPGNNNYGYLQGTSMAAPIVSHIAAMLRAYYPSLSAVDVKSIIMQSSWKPSNKEESYSIPQKEDSKTLQQIAAAGGIVNAAKAIAMANSFPTKKSEKTKSKNILTIKTHP
jgi:subtilisin family serine protease